MAALKYSRQREAIKSDLISRKDHPTAEMVYENIRRIYPNVSLGTVYRNLSLLVELGEIQKLDGFAGRVHFDGRTDYHAHFLCESCGCVSDLENEEALSSLLSAAEKGFPGQIRGCSTRFFGLCEKCLSTQK